MSKIVSISEAMNHVKSDMSVMIGGFFWCGSPFSLIRGLTARAGDVTNLTLISNDAGSAKMKPESYGNALIETGMITKCIASFIGHNKAAMKKITEGDIELEMLPMGTLSERIRIGGAGIGGFLTPTGVGTVVAEGKEIINVDGVDYLLEKPLRANVALIYGSVVDKNGNVRINGSARNFNPLMATAADYVIVEAKEIVENGQIDPSDVTIPATFVDAIVKSNESDYVLW